MWSRRVSYKQAYKTLHEALPLFNATDSFTRLLELYATCNCSPTSDHPALQEWLGISYQHNSDAPPQPVLSSRHPLPRGDHQERSYPLLSRSNGR
ncbi:hypothetical protein BC826DRAFT_980394 [Russula brevipes]|nr:hypothetical protein BC826DRAFT_980394 [Russula brevipes]